MKMKHRSLVVVGAALVAGLGVSSQAQALQRFYLDAHEIQAPGDEYAGPVTSDPVLVNLSGLTPHYVIVRGAVSLWAQPNWTSPRFQVCGTPLDSAPYASLGVADGKVGVDANGRFALVRKPSGPCPSLPDVGGGNLQIDAGTGFETLKPLALFSSPSAHRYVYRVFPTAAGRISVRFYDPAAYDNTGRFQITVTDVL